MKKLLIVFYFLVAILIIENVVAVGITSPGRNIVIDFKPNLEKTLTFGARSNMATAMDVSLGVSSSELAEYITMSKNSVFLETGQTKSFTVTIKFPNEIDVTPGDHKIKVTAVESPTGGGIAARGAVSTHFTIRIPYPGKYIRVYFDVKNVNVNEPVDFKITIRNLGTEDLKNAYGTIDVYDGFENKLRTINIEQTEVKAQSSKDILKTMDTTSFKSGSYKAIATVYYFENKTTIEKSFKIGSLDVKLINYTKEFEKDSINKFDIEIESGWNNKIPDIYADVMIKKEGKEIASLKTPNTDLNPWGKKTISTYWDTNNIEEGEYDSVITLYYSGKKTVEAGKLSVIAKKKKFLEIPGLINTTTMLILLILILIIINVIWLMKRKKKEGKKREN